MRIGRRHRLFLGLAAAVAVLTGAAALVFHLVTLSPGQPVTAPTAEPGVPWFVDVAGASGVTFRHFDPATPMHYIHETLGSGLGWVDYNNDGWPDLFVVQDGPVRPGPGPRPR